LQHGTPVHDFFHSSPEFCHPNFLRLFYWPQNERPDMISNTEDREPKDESCVVRRTNSLAGVVLCAGAAVAASAVASGHPWRVWVPLVFSVVLLLIALFFGVRAGIAGTLLAALVFAMFLFGPLGSIHVTDGVARSNLGWMLLIGLAFSLLFAPPASGFRRR
jgi:K+-sensing histidine kinase KdpD